MRPFRFAVTATRARTAGEWIALAKRAEDLGYDILLVTDHLGAQLAPFPALTAAALATTRLRVGSFVFANDYRAPVMLAKEAATLDLLSGGRLELGIGAGWSTSDYQQLGIAYDPPAVRVSRLIEAVGLIDRLWTEDAVDHVGRHYRVNGARVLPRPVQRPRPPFMIGGGSPRILRFAAERADIVALSPRVDSEGKPRLTSLSESAVARNVELVRAAAGARFASLELNVIVFDAAITGAGGSLLADVATRLKATAAAVVDSPFFLFGTLERIRELVVRRREELGISYLALPQRAMEELAPLVKELTGR